MHGVKLFLLLETDRISGLRRCDVTERRSKRPIAAHLGWSEPLQGPFDGSRRRYAAHAQAVQAPPNALDSHKSKVYS